MQDEIFDGVEDVVLKEHASGYRRVLETVQASRSLQLTANPLVGVMLGNDRAGICHQLANDDLITWVKGKKP